ncbi:MAG: DnaB-like helicase C-terminal domain-containing protein [Candidatus Omnitrophota bacterium]
MRPMAVSSKERSSPVLVKDEVGDVLKDIELRSKPGSGYLRGLATGFTDLDRVLMGLQPGQLIACLARPSMGKTAFASSIMLNIARQKAPVLYFSLNDISKQELLSRFMCALGQVDITRVRAGVLDDTQRTKIAAGAGILAELPIYIDTRVRTIQEIERLIKNHVKRHGVKFVVIDPLQAIDNYVLLNNTERYKAYDMVCRRLKHLSRLCNIPIFLTVWLSRRFEEDESKRRLHCLSQIFREEGNLEVNADVILQLHREDYYDPTPENTGIADICVIKGGPKSRVNLRFSRDNGLAFENLG